MSALSKDVTVLPEEYLALERAAEHRSEYLNGVIVGMAGATFTHNIIVVNITASLATQLAHRPCLTFSSDMKVRIERANDFRYPDVSAVCGPVLFHDGKEDTYLNPALIVEVLSPGTERYDRTEKFAAYRLIESLTEYLIVAQDRRFVELFRKQPDGKWRSFEFIEPHDDELIILESIGCTLRVSEIYAKTALAAKGAA